MDGDGAAGGRRPLLRHPVDQGVRRRLGARPARVRANRFPSRLAHGVPAAAERRLGARRLPPRTAARTTSPGSSGSSTPRSPTVGKRCRTRSRSPVSARATRPPPRSQRSAARRRRVRRRSPLESSWRSPRPCESAGAGEDQPRARGRPAAAPTASMRSRPCSSASTSPIVSRSPPARGCPSTGFADDTIVRDALVALAAAAGVEPLWAATITKRIPVAAGLGGGSSDAATALRLANETLDAPARDGRPAHARRHARRGRPLLPR